MQKGNFLPVNRFPRGILFFCKSSWQRFSQAVYSNTEELGAPALLLPQERSHIIQDRISGPLGFIGHTAK